MSAPTRTRRAAAPSTWSDSLPELAGITQAAMDPIRIEQAMRDGYATGHAAGSEDGYAAGFAAGEQAGLAALEAERQRLRSMLATLQSQLDRVARSEEDLRSAFETPAVDTALAVAEMVVGRELAVAADPGRDALVRALAVAPTDAATAMVRLSPIDVEHLGDIAALAPGTDLTVVADPAVASGDCVLVLGDTSIDAAVGAALARVREALS